MGGLPRERPFTTRCFEAIVASPFGDQKMFGRKRKNADEFPFDSNGIQADWELNYIVDKKMRGRPSV